jgi:hypothetical protein
MKQTLLLLLCLFINKYLSAQKTPTEEAAPIVAEAKKLYLSEMASWYGTDLFLENYKNRENIGGYFSYSDGTISKCIFFSRQEPVKAIGTISFDSTYNVQTAEIDVKERTFSDYETSIYIIRKKALEAIQQDTLFKTYENTNLNLIPLVNGDDKKVYVLTGPEKSGVVIFGNDYLITFDKDNQIVSKKQLHKNIIPIYYGNEEEGQTNVGAMHSHLPETGEFITATDICTLMLYSKFAKWNQHNVVSKTYLNIWNCITNQLTVIPLATIQKINEDQEKRKRKKKEE